MDLGLAGRRAAVAAASSGLGFACAAALAAEGARVAMCSRSGDRIRDAAGRIGSRGLGGVPRRARGPGGVPARAGATGFLKTLAREVAGDGVTVNSVQPGLHTTERLADVYGDDLASLAAGVPTGTLGRPEDFGAVVAFLCSDSARFITGAAIPVDGGAYAGLL